MGARRPVGGDHRRETSDRSPVHYPGAVESRSRSAEPKRYAGTGTGTSKAATVSSAARSLGDLPRRDSRRPWICALHQRLSSYSISAGEEPVYSHEGNAGGYPPPSGLRPAPRWPQSARRTEPSDASLATSSSLYPSSRRIASVCCATVHAGAIRPGVADSQAGGA